MLELSSLDLEEIVGALSEQTDYENQWLIDPQTGEIVFWMADTGIDGQTPVDLDELDLVCINPLPSWVWHQDMADFAEGITNERAGRRLARAIQGKGAFRLSKTNSTRSTRTCCQPGMPSAMPARCAAPAISSAHVLECLPAGFAVPRAGSDSHHARQRCSAPGCPGPVMPSSMTAPW